MNPLALGIPLALPTLAVASHAAAGGLGLLKTLLNPSSRLAQPATSSLSAETVSLQQALADEVRRAGLGNSLPLEVTDNGQGGLSVLSDGDQGEAIEQRLNANPYLVQKFQSLAQRAGALFRLVVPASSRLDTSA